MPKTYFIADLHLSETTPKLTALFIEFIQHKAIYAESLYILGDLFDFWIGDDEQSALINEVKQQLKQLTDSGVKCYFIHGNRDFLIGKKFAQETGVILLGDYQPISLYGRKILLCHGDTLCIDDVHYQKFRQKVQQKWLQRLFLYLPLRWRIKIAENIRQKSNQDKQKKANAIMDVNPLFTQQKVQQFGVDWLIHGHTHRENMHQEQTFTRIVLGDWRDNYASILMVSPEKIEFIAA